MPSVLWHWWLGSRKGIRPVKKLSGGVLKSKIILSFYHIVHFCLQCFDAVGWAAGRASGL